MVHLRLLGGAGLEDASGAALGGPAAHRHALGLLALLALAPGRTLTRGKLVGYLWPDAPEKAARNRLSTLVHRLRGAAGDDVLESVGGELRLLRECVDCDVDAFREALDGGDAEEAVSLYRGPFLDGFWLRGSPEFERWADVERDRLARDHRRALQQLAEAAEARGDPAAAVARWRELACEEPFDSRVAFRLMRAVAGAGNRAAALRIARTHAGFLEEELGSDAEAETRRLVEALEAEERPLAASPQPRAERRLDPRAVAVLPLEDLAGSDEGRAFAAGLHHDLLTRLSRVAGLTVISRGSILRYRKQGRPLSEMARELGVGTLIEGGFRQTGDRLRLNVEVVDAASGGLRWADSFDSEFTPESFFDIQSDLAERITGSLRAGIDRRERARIRRSSAGTLDTYLLYVQGRTHLAQRIERGVGRAAEYFHRAIEVEPAYAPAWAGLAGALALCEWYGYPLPEHDPDPMGSARRALELDPELGEAHTSMGIVRAARQEGPEAVRALTRAVELDPGDAEAHTWLGWIRTVLGEPAAGVPASERAAELDPMAPYTRVFLGKVYLAAGRTEAALAEVRSARELQPDYGLAHFMEGLCLHHLGRFSEAVFALEEAAPLVSPGSALPPTEVWGVLAATRAAAGDEAGARELLERVRQAGAPFATGLAHAALGEIGAAFEAFDGVRRWGSFSTPILRYLLPEALDPVRDDRRFGLLVARVDASWGLEPGSDRGSNAPAGPTGLGGAEAGAESG